MKALLGLTGIVVTGILWGACNLGGDSTVSSKADGHIKEPEWSQPMETFRSKPGAAMTIDLKPGNVLGPAKRQATLVFTPEVPCAHVEIVATAAEGLQIDGGASVVWKLAAEKGVQATHDVVLTVTAPGGHRIAVSATMCSGDGSRQTVVAVFYLNAEGRLRPAFATRHPGARVIEGPDKQKIVEIPAAEPQAK